MPNLAFKLKSGVACTETPDSGVYYGYCQQSTSGPRLQPSMHYDLGTDLVGSGSSIETALSVLKRVSRQATPYIGAISVVKLCTSRFHSGDQQASGYSQRLERVITLFRPKPGATASWEPRSAALALLVPDMKENGHFQPLKGEPPFQNVVSAPMTNDEKRTMPITAVYEAFPSRTDRARTPAYSALHGLRNELVLDWGPWVENQIFPSAAGIPIT